jgi:hypothetical protein
MAGHRAGHLSPHSAARDHRVKPAEDVLGRVHTATRRSFLMRSGAWNVAVYSFSPRNVA